MQASAHSDTLSYPHDVSLATDIGQTTAPIGVELEDLERVHGEFLKLIL